MVTFIPAFVSAATAAWGKGLETSIFNAKTSAEMEQMEKDYAAVHGPAPAATLAQVADHIDHVARIAGHDHVGIGSDFYGSTDEPEGLEDVSRFPDLFAELIRRGWSDGDLEKLAGGNVLRVLGGGGGGGDPPRRAAAALDRDDRSAGRQEGSLTQSMSLHHRNDLPARLGGPRGRQLLTESGLRERAT